MKQYEWALDALIDVIRALNDGHPNLALSLARTALRDQLRDPLPMTTFRFYVVDLYDGAVHGTDSEDTAQEFASADFTVIDTRTGRLLADGESFPITEVEE